jgi:hypothetical protein
MENQGQSVEVELKNKVWETGVEGHPCYKMTEDLTGPHPCLRALWNAELRSNELGRISVRGTI